MGFKPLAPRAQHRNDPVCISLQKRTSHGRATVVIEISLSPQFVHQLHWSVGHKYEVSVGEGPDEGYVRIRPSVSGYTLKLPGNTSSRPRLTLNYWGSEARFSNAPCNARPDTINKTLVVELPWHKRLLKAAE